MLHVDLPPHSVGGVARQVDLLARTLTARGHVVQVWSTTPGPPDAPYEVHVLSRPSGAASRAYGVAVGFRRVRTRGEVDVVHAHGDDWLMPRATPRVRTFYGSALREAWSATSAKRRAGQSFAYATEWLSASRAEVSVSISRTSRRQLPLVREVVPCAVDAEFFGPASGFEQGQLERGERGPRVLYVAGSLGGRKRGHLVVEAVRQLQHSHRDLRLTLVCPDVVDLPFVDQRTDVSTAELASLYRSSDVLCSASSYEGFGVPYAEALASGLPVVTTNNPGAREVLAGGQNGVIVDPAGLQQALHSLLSDPARRAALAQRGRQAAEQYRPETVAAAYVRLYRRARERSTA